MTRAERMFEVRQWCELISKQSVGKRVMMDAQNYAHWSDVQFLLMEIDAMMDDTKTPCTAMEPIRLPEPKATRSRVHVDPADFTDTITIEPPRDVVIVKPEKDVATGKHHAIHPSLPPLKLPEAPRTSSLSEADVWNAAIARASLAVERALSEATTKHYDIYATKAAAQRYVSECRKPVEWGEEHTA